MNGQTSGTNGSVVNRVEAEGMAAGDGGNARAEALTAALREAVRIGVGVNIVEQSQVTDFQLDFDRVFAQSFGYVKNYKVLSTALGEDGLYRVKIQAEVAPGNPADNDRMTFKMLARARQTPRVLIQLDEEIDGKSGSTTGADWYANLARELGVQVAASQAAEGGMAARRAELLDRGTESGLRRAGVVSSHDYVLKGKVIANSAEPETIAGTLRRMCSVAVELRIIDPIAGQVIVSDVMEARRFALEASLSPEVACREAIRRSLSESASGDSNTEPGMKVMRMLFCHWIAEMDLGAVFRVEMAGLELYVADQLRANLAERDKVGAVWVRSIDPAGVSVIDVETRLDALELAQVLCSASGNTFALDRSDNRYLSLVPSARASEDASPVEVADIPSGNFPYAATGWGMIAIGALAFIVKTIASKSIAS